MGAISFLFLFKAQRYAISTPLTRFLLQKECSFFNMDNIHRSYSKAILIHYLNKLV